MPGLSPVPAPGPGRRPPGTVAGVNEQPRISPVAVLLVAAVAALAGAAGLAVSWSLLGAGPTSATAPVGASAGTDDAEGWAPWARNDDGRPVQWDPCSPIELVVDPEGAYPGFRRDLDEATAEIATISGIDVQVVDEVSERPDARRDVFQPDRYGQRWAPVLVAFAEPGENDLPLTDVDRGLASPVAVGPAGDRVYVTGQVVFNVERTELRPGSDDRADSWGSTLRHELGHLVGLAHTPHEDELMHTYPGQGPVRWGEGDRRGLEALGEGPCRDVPAPRHLDVEVGPPA